MQFPSQKLLISAQGSGCFSLSLVLSLSLSVCVCPGKPYSMGTNSPLKDANIPKSLWGHILVCQSIAATSVSYYHKGNFNIRRGRQTDGSKHFFYTQTELNVTSLTFPFSLLSLSSYLCGQV